MKIFLEYWNLKMQVLNSNLNLNVKTCYNVTKYDYIFSIIWYIYMITFSNKLKITQNKSNEKSMKLCFGA